MIAVRPSSVSRHLRRAALAAVAIAVLCALLFISPSPAVPSEARPDVADVRAARVAWHRLKAAQDADTATPVRLNNRMIRALAVLASDATSIANFAAKVDQGVLSAETSISLPAGLWVNVSAAATGEHSGFPPFRLKVGRVSFPSVAGPYFAGAARMLLHLRGASIPPLDEIIQHVRISRNIVHAELALPRGSRMVSGVVAASGTRLNNPLVSEIYCQLAAAQRADPAPSLADLVRSTLTQANASGDDEYTREGFVALSFLVVGDKAEAVAPTAARLIRKCPRPRRPVLLHQRQDLSKHWALSAALAAVLGERAATSLGEWKELDDSLPAGSGFSFVDIAADRAGLRTALRALDPESAQRTLAELGRATEEDLLPKALLKAPEGLSKAQFRDRFGSIDKANYRRAVASIDQVLVKEGL
jgi:hypothetical protein